MKVCYLNNQYPKVSHTFIRREIQALEAEGVGVLRVCARQNSEGLVDEMDIKELKQTHSIAQGKIAKVLLETIRFALCSPLIFLKTMRKALSLGVRDELQIHKYLIYLVEACYLLKLCKLHHIDHVHAHFGTNPTSVAMLCRLLGGPKYSFTVHGPEEFDRPISLSLTEKIKYADFVVAISYFCQSQLYRWCPSLEDWKKIHIVRCALEEKSFLNTCSITEGNRRFLAIGRLSEQKGFPLLIEAVALLKQSTADFQLDIVGDGPMREEMERYIKDRGLGDQVSLLGYKSGGEIIALLDRSSCLIVPSFAEGLPVVIMEAMARKRPVLTTQIAAMSELVEDQVNGWIIPPGSLECLVACMLKVLDMPCGELNKMGGAGWRKVKKQHNSETEAKKLLELFKQEVPVPGVNISV